MKNFWTNIALSELLGNYLTDADTPSSTSTDADYYIRFINDSNKSVGKLSKKQIKWNATSKEKELYRVRRQIIAESDEQQYASDTRLFPSSNIRLDNRLSEDTALFAGNTSDYRKLRSLVTKPNSGFPGFRLTYENRQYEYIVLVNEKNLFYGEAFKSISRKQAKKAKDRIIFNEFDVESGSREQSDLVRSFRVRQAKGVEIWIKDGLFLVDTRGTSYDSSNRIEGIYGHSFLFTENAVPLGDYEEDYEYKENGDNFRSTEFGIIAYEPSKFNKNVRKVFPSEVSAFDKAKTAPVFIGYEKTQLSFDWLTGMAMSNHKRIARTVSLIGKNASIFNSDQVYIALEHVDIVTGAGKDLVILADDLNNKSQSHVPRIHDFRRGQDKALIPIDVFSGFKMTKNGKLPKSSFVSGKRATNKKHRLIFDSSSGFLYHDRDGAGGATQQLIASFTNKPSLTAGDFLLG